MFAHNKRLQYTVRVQETNPGLANLMLEQFGGPQGELAAALRYFHQYIAESDPGRRDMLIDIATEELSHLEVIGTIIAMLNKGAQGRIAEGVDSEAEMYRRIGGAGNDSHTTLDASAAQVSDAAAERLQSNPDTDPVTGAMLGMDGMSAMNADGDADLVGGSTGDGAGDEEMASIRCAPGRSSGGSGTRAPFPRFPDNPGSHAHFARAPAESSIE